MDLWVFLVQPLHHSQGGDKHSWLTVNRLHQLLLGSLQTQRQQVVAKDLLGHRKHLFNVGVLQKPPSHAHELSALAGEKEHGAGTGVNKGSPLFNLRERCHFVRWRGTVLVGAKSPAERAQGPNLPPGGSLQHRRQHDVLLTYLCLHN